MFTGLEKSAAETQHSNWTNQVKTLEPVRADPFLWREGTFRSAIGFTPGFGRRDIDICVIDLGEVAVKRVKIFAWFVRAGDVAAEEGDRRSGQNDLPRHAIATELGQGHGALAKFSFEHGLAIAYSVLVYGDVKPDIPSHTIAFPGQGPSARPII